MQGDSTAISWVPALQKALGNDWTVEVQTMDSCPFADIAVTMPGDASASEGCASFQTWQRGQIAEQKPDLVLFAQADNTTAHVSEPSKAGAWADVRKATATTVERASVSADHVLVLGAPPPFQKPTSSCATAINTPASCVQNVGHGHLPHQGDLVKALADAGRMNATFVDTDTWFCAADARCPVFALGSPIMADATHLTGAYSAKLGPALASVIGQRLR